MILTLAEIQAKCTPALIASRNQEAIAAVVNVGRKRPKVTHLGEGGIIAAIGDIDAGNTFLDVVNTATAYRHIKKVIARGDFDMGATMSQAGVKAMIGTVLTQAQSDALCALGFELDPVSAHEVARVLEGT